MPKKDDVSVSAPVKRKMIAAIVCGAVLPPWFRVDVDEVKELLAATLAKLPPGDDAALLDAALLAIERLEDLV